MFYDSEWERKTLRKVKKRSQGRTKYLIVASIILLAVIIIAVVLATNVPPPKPTASEYFSVVAIGAIAWNTTSPNTVAVKSLYLNVTPVMGDAHQIYIYYEGASDTIAPEPYNGTVLKGHTWEVEIQFSTYMAPVVNGQLEFFELITIDSMETAKSGPMTVTLARNNVTILPGSPTG